MQKTLHFSMSDLNGIVLNTYQKYRSVVRFLLVGCLNTGVDFLIFTSAYSLLGFDKFVSQCAGYSMGITNSFVLNKLWTFENKKSNFRASSQLLRFIAVNLVSLSMSLWGLKLLCDVAGMNPYLAKILVTGMTQAVNYAGYRLWVFNR